MARVLINSLWGSENPTRAAFPFLWAKTFAEAGHTVEVELIADAVVLMRDAVMNSVVPVGWPPLKDLMADTIKHKVPIYV